MVCYRRGANLGNEDGVRDRRHIWWASVVLACAAVMAGPFGGSASSADQRVALRPLEAGPPPLGFLPWFINRDGWVIGPDAPGTCQTGVWSPAGRWIPSILNGNVFYPTGLTNTNIVIGTNCAPGPRYAFRHDLATGSTSILEGFTPSDATIADRSNDRGDIVGVVKTDAFPSVETFVWWPTGATAPQPIDLHGESISRLWSLSDDRFLVALADDSPGLHYSVFNLETNEHWIVGAVGGPGGDVVRGGLMTGTSPTGAFWWSPFDPVQHTLGPGGAWGLNSNGQVLYGEPESLAADRVHFRLLDIHDGSSIPIEDAMHNTAIDARLNERGQVAATFLRADGRRFAARWDSTFGFVDLKSDADKSQAYGISPSGLVTLSAANERDLYVADIQQVPPNIPAASSIVTTPTSTTQRAPQPVTATPRFTG